MSHPLLTAPIGRSLLRLAGPTTGFMFVQIGVGIADTWIIGRLGTDALAGAALVVPFIVLMMNMANGGMGGSVTASFARALGGGRIDDARSLVWHALSLGLALALVFTALAWTVAPTLYEVMGGSGAALSQARLFSALWFSGAVLLWPMCFLSALLRGSGDSLTPSRIGVAMSILYVPLSAILTLGIGAWPGLGLAGPAVASNITILIDLLWLIHAIRAARLGFVPTLTGVRLEPRLYWEILRVGLLGSVTTIAASATAVAITGYIGRFGTAALAGYGVAIRLEFMVAPIAFGIGTGLTTMVGVAAGAHDWRRAIRVAWTGGLFSFAIIGLIGGATALFPEPWARIFSNDPEVLAVATAGITRVGPFYCLFGLGLTLNFASQGAARMSGPLVGSLVRFTVAAGGGWLAIEHWGLGLNGVFFAVAASLAAYGSVIGGNLIVRPWRTRENKA